MHVALHAARAHLLHQTQRALERALAVLPAALHNDKKSLGFRNPGKYVCTLRSTPRARISSTRLSSRLSARWLCCPPPCTIRKGRVQG